MKVKSHNQLQKELAEKIKQSNEWYSLRHILGYDWAIFYLLLGGRETGKSYAVTKFYVGQFIKYGRPFYWLRLTESSASKLLTNNAEKLVDPDLRRRYNLDLVTNGENVYQVLKRGPSKNGKPGPVIEKKLMARVLSLSTFYNDKGSGFFDKDFLNNPNMYYNICLDEMNREKNERNSFDIIYALVNELENLVRSTKGRIRVICIGNYLDDASDLLTAFNFLPTHFGTFKLVKNKAKLIDYLNELKKCQLEGRSTKYLDAYYSNVDFGKRCVIEYIAPNEVYRNRRKGTIADILTPTASTFTNQGTIDFSLVTSMRLVKAQAIIKFSKDCGDWFTLWNNGIIARYHKEKCTTVIAMRPYLDTQFDITKQRSTIELFDTRSFKYHDLQSAKLFEKQIKLLKPRK